MEHFLKSFLFVPMRLSFMLLGEFKFGLKLSHGSHFFPVSFDCFIQYSDLNFSKRALEVVLVLRPPSWFGRCAPGVILVDPSFLGRFNTAACYLQLCNINSYFGLLTSRSFTNGFGTITRLVRCRWLCFSIVFEVQICFLYYITIF